MERRIKLDTFDVVMDCIICKKGQLIQCDDLLSTVTPGYPHLCTVCEPGVKHKDRTRHYLDNRYPYLVYEPTVANSL